jgi:hypothetical protein
VEEVKPSTNELDPLNSNFDYSILSPLPIERLSSPSSPFNITSSKFSSPPGKLHLSREDKFDFQNLKLETLLTPTSIRKSVTDNHPKRPTSPFPQLKQLSPSPPPVTKTITGKLFKEEISPEMMLRIKVPIIPPDTAKKGAFPGTMFEIWTAERGLQCDVIPRSVIDGLNGSVRWAPIKSQKGKFLKECQESLEEVKIEEFMGSQTVEWKFVMRKSKDPEEEFISVREEVESEMEEVLQVEYSSPPQIDTVGEIIRKRKFQDIPRGVRENEKRLRYSGYGQMNRVCEYMVLHGRPLPTIEEEPVSPGILHAPLPRKRSPPSFTHNIVLNE